MIVEEIVNKPIDSNSFVLYEKGNSKCIVVDPGSSNCICLLKFFKIHNLIPEYIFLTHEHFDHIWGVNRLKETFNCKTVCSKECAEKIVDSKKNMSVFYNQIGFKTFPADILIEDIDFNLVWNNLKIEFIVSKGHTEGSMCIFVDGNLFTGDTIIKGHKTIFKFPGGSKNNLLNSLVMIFSKFERKTIHVRPGHGNCFFLNEIAIEQLV